MHMRHVSWVLMAGILALLLTAVGAFAQAMPDQSTVSQSQTTVEQSSSSTTVTNAPPAVAPGTTVVPGTVAVAPVLPGTVTYLPASEISFTGVVVNGPLLAAPTDMDYQMTIRTSDGVLHRIWLAPERFVRRHRFAPAVNDEVTVIGMPIGATGDILARQITWGRRTYDFRNAEGAPLWMPAPVAGAAYPAYGAAGPFPGYARLWNPNRMRTISGRIDRIQDYYPAGQAAGPGVAIRVRVAGLEPEDIPSWQMPVSQAAIPANYVWVHLGPSWYVQQQFPDLHKGQNVTVTGVPAVWRRQPVLLASSLQVGSRVVAFRGPTGNPMWAGGWQNWQGMAVGEFPGYTGSAMAYPGYTMGALQTISGTIQNVQTVPAVGAFGPATMLTILTASGQTVTVAVAPASFAQQTGLQFQLGQPITVVAAPLMVSQPMLVANQVFYDNQTFAMTNLNGRYSWSAITVGPPVGTAVLPSNFQTISGTIQSVQSIPAAGTFAPATLVSIATPQNCTANVVIAPASFAGDMGIELTPGQQITIVASPTTWNGQSAMLASQIDYHGQRFVMNNANGTFTWSAVTGVAALPSGAVAQ